MCPPVFRSDRPHRAGRAPDLRVKQVTTNHHESR
ncbi:hypothetical protein KEK_16938 [Mycolicibacterium thermoresistibile ATCC 19527]|uniref:Uncharacterized protein n=1 Tax=Mycolicibacterium thermoresistibile (strain ATCC 19527 / DSM 44167 / CIP 105390 / JCM 6362 / NCTC 10409 / 316) TaxID=1078020 RepID=G7CIS6_MYCT3|nr:hypothetical protein KEK_16938 [Mycolicibacterium thermoresistibile ATCC 19527]